MRKRVKIAEWRARLLAEMVARLLKNILRMRYRRLTSQQSSISNEAFRRTTLEVPSLRVRAPG